MPRFNRRERFSTSAAQAASTAPSRSLVLDSAVATRVMFSPPVRGTKDASPEVKVGRYGVSKLGHSFVVARRLRCSQCPAPSRPPMIEQSILTIQEERVMLDANLATLYGGLARRRQVRMGPRLWDSSA